jgi:hypothetical protein
LKHFVNPFKEEVKFIQKRLDDDEYISSFSSNQKVTKNILEINCYIVYIDDEKAYRKVSAILKLIENLKGKNLKILFV